MHVNNKTFNSNRKYERTANIFMKNEKSLIIR